MIIYETVIKILLPSLSNKYYFENLLSTAVTIQTYVLFTYLLNT